MKNFFYFLLVIFTLFLCLSQKSDNKEVAFVYDKINKAREEKKLTVFEFINPENEYDRKLEHDIFENEKIRSFLNKNFELVEIVTTDSVYKPLKKYFNVGNECTVVILDCNGNEIERTVDYHGNSELYLNFLSDVTEGKNLYAMVISAYQRDSLSARNNYLLANKLKLRNRLNEASDKYKKVLLYDPEDKLHYNQECRFRIAENGFILTGNLSELRKIEGIELEEP